VTTNQLRPGAALILVLVVRSHLLADRLWIPALIMS
jgi:hypothetical protein